jgi:hypothetical protein
MCQTHFSKRASRQPKQIFKFCSCGGILDLRVAIVPPIRTMFSLTRLVVVGTYGWIGQQSGSGFINLAPSILHYNWF